MSGSTRTFRPTRREAAQPPFTEATFRDWHGLNTNMIGRISFDETRISRQLRGRVGFPRIPHRLTNHETELAAINSCQPENHQGQFRRCLDYPPILYFSLVKKQ